MVTNIVEYNKIHSLANARRKVIQKFGRDILHFWGMADDTGFIRDLLRNKPLFATSNVEVQYPGFVDFGMNVRDGEIADVVRDVGVTSGGTEDVEFSSSDYLAIPVPPGKWEKVKARVDPASTAGYYLHIIPAGGTIADAYYTSPQYGYNQAGWITATWTFPNTVSSTGDKWLAIHVPNISDSIVEAGAPGGLTGLKKFNSTTSAWEAVSADGLENFIFYSDQGPVNWPYCDEITVGIAVNIDENMPYDAGAILALSNATENKIRIFLNADRTVQGSAKSNGDNTYTVTSPKILHPGFNLIILSYKRSDSVKLSINGQVVDTETGVSSHTVLGGAFVLSLGCQILADSSLTKSDLVKNLIVDDLFIGNKVLTDDEIWDIYCHFITTAPLMLVDDTTTVEPTV